MRSTTASTTLDRRSFQLGASISSESMELGWKMVYTVVQPHDTFYKHGKRRKGNFVDVSKTKEAESVLVIVRICPDNPRCPDEMSLANANNGGAVNSLG